jgi:hypothetical protein
MAMALAACTAACASSSENILPTYVSPVLYENYTCEQLMAEGQRVSAHAAEVAGVQDKNRTNDTVKTTVGVLLFWPILFANEGNGQTAAQLANLKGQKEAIEQASIRKNCGIRFQNTKS